MRAVVKAGHTALAEYTESVLKRLGYKFVVNGGGDVFEFEVNSPHRFIVSVRDASGYKMRAPLIVTKRRESVVDIRRMLGGEGDEQALVRAANAVASGLSAQYPKLKWKDTLWVD